MFKISFTIANPFKRQKGLLNSFSKDRTITLSDNKSFECQIAQWEMYNLFDFELALIWWGQDHAGPSLTVEILGLMFNVKIYDHRHWDHENNKWEVY